jgi:HSP20 family protein
MTTAATAPRAVHRVARPPARRRQPHVPADVYRCDDHDIVLCDLPGADTGSLDLRVAAPPSPSAATAAPGREHHTICVKPVTATGATATYTDGCCPQTIPAAAPRPRHVHDARWPAHVRRAIA